MTSPIDTIREALNPVYVTPAKYEAALAALDALTEVEHQLAATRPIQWPSASTEVQFCLHERRCLELREAKARVVAAEKALAESRGALADEMGLTEQQRARAEAAETALAEAEDGRDALVDEIQREYVLRSTHLAIVGAAERRANDLERLVDEARPYMEKANSNSGPINDWLARAALDRQEQKETP